MASIEQLEAQVFTLQHQNAMLRECIRIGEGLARDEGYKRGYYAGKKWKQRRWAEPKSRTGRRFPMHVSCYGRSYEAKTEDELGDLLQNLIEGRLSLANRYRVATTKHSRWPKGEA